MKAGAHTGRSADLSAVALTTADLSRHSAEHDGGSSGLLKAARPSRTPTRERSAPTSAWSCRHCPQDCAPAALATLGTMPPPPGEGFADSSLLRTFYLGFRFPTSSMSTHVGRTYVLLRSSVSHTYASPFAVLTGFISRPPTFRFTR